MISIFSLFQDIKNAQYAIHQLLKNGFREDEMNCIVHESTAKLYLDISRQELKAEVSQSLGSNKINGIERLFAGQHPIDTSDTGRILAAGKSGMIVAKAATTSTVKRIFSLKSALSTFGLGNQESDTYQKKLSRGETLFWIRVENKDSPLVVNILRDHDGKEISTV